MAMAGMALRGREIEFDGGEMRLSWDGNGKMLGRNGWRNCVRLVVLVALVLTGMAQGVRAQEAEEQKPCPVKAPPPPEQYVTIFLKNVSQPNDANDLQTTLRNIAGPRARIYYDQSVNAILVRGTADDLAMAQKMIAELDLPKKAYRLQYTVRLMDGSKATATQHYSLVVVLGERGQLKLGNRVPLVTGKVDADTNGASSQVQYMDVGLSISGTLTGSGDDLILRTKVEQSTLAEDKSGVGPQDPVMHQAVLEQTGRLVPGKAMTLGSMDIPGGASRLEVEVVVEGVR
jgi:type II secretory pathway component GspD/PulD (secretin)